MRVLIVYNAPLLPDDHPDYASEAGVIESVESFAAALARHDVARLPLGTDFEPLLHAARGSERPDVIVNFCEGFGGSAAAETYFAGLLELVGIPYTGSGPETLALVREKARTKWLLLGAGLPTPRFRLRRAGEALALDELARELQGGPLFVKPAGEDASLGITGDNVITGLGQLQRKVADLEDRYGDVLIEEYIDGREFNISVLALPEPSVLPLAEVNFGRDASCPYPVVTYDAKWTPDSSGWNSTPVTCPAVVAPELAGRIREVALAAFRITGCRHYARVDLRVSPAGEVYILEVNANPDIGPTAGFARSLAASGMAYAEFVERLTECAQRGE